MRKMPRRQLIAWMCCVGFVMSGLVGCGDSGDNDDNTPPSDAGADASVVFDVGDCGGDCDDGDPCTCLLYHI